MFQRAGHQRWPFLDGGRWRRVARDRYGGYGALRSLRMSRSMLGLTRAAANPDLIAEPAGERRRNEAKFVEIPAARTNCCETQESICQ
jgi:hypothetical protein